MPIRFDTFSNKETGGTTTPRDEPDLDPPYDRRWPSWVLRARRRRWTAVPVLELCALLICLAAILSLSRPDMLSFVDGPAQASSPMMGR
ncbi:MAG: hypothetical protein AAF678_04550 [Pseudomonadota bacterium]